MTVPVHAIVGPTASGKESVALLVAEGCGAEILTMDSMKVYREMEAGTAKAGPADRARVPHHLNDLADPSESFSARRWLDAAEAALRDVRSRARLPLFVGGTALYLKALLYGLFEGPSADASLRAALRALPCEVRYRRLLEVDPETALAVHPNDERRVVRALELHELTGRPASELRREWKSSAPPRPARLAGLRHPRPRLYERIDRRVDRMIEGGLVAEVRSLLERRPPLGPVARQALGYKEVADWLEGRVPDLPEAIRLLKRRTRLFARRQLTWYRHFDIAWVDAAAGETPQELAPRVAAALGIG